MERKEITMGTFFFSSPIDFFYPQTENKIYPLFLSVVVKKRAKLLTLDYYEFILERVVAVNVGVGGFHFLFLPGLANFAFLEGVVTQKISSL